MVVVAKGEHTHGLKCPSPPLFPFFPFFPFFPSFLVVVVVVFHRPPLSLFVQPSHALRETAMCQAPKECCRSQPYTPEATGKTIHSQPELDRASTNRNTAATVSRARPRTEKVVYCKQGEKAFMVIDTSMGFTVTERV